MSSFKKKYFGYFFINSIIRNKIKEKYTNAIYNLINEEDINKFLSDKIKEQSSFLSQSINENKERVINFLAEITDLTDILCSRLDIQKEDLFLKIKDINENKGSYSNILLETLAIEEDSDMFREYSKIFKIKKFSDIKLA